MTTTSPPIIGGHTGFGSTVLQLLAASTTQIEEVAAFRATPQDFSAPRMQQASSLPAAPLAEMEFQLDITA